ncbi:unnamed protein product [Owenia fusiformis]|uniref:Cytochrome P450 n=1 Tax=Owenia fusiformis TaxID=6347 RepID=A0A8S4N2H4_OWEFU|nr:unnamed protein product [Owenia fusiformis]
MAFSLSDAVEAMNFFIFFALPGSLYDAIVQVIIIASILILIWYLRLPPNLPPGPLPIPIFGSIKRIRGEHMDFQSMYEEYGNVTSMYVNEMLMVVISGPRAVREALVQNANVFAGRPPHNSFNRWKLFRKAFFGKSYTEEFKRENKLMAQMMRNFTTRSKSFDSKLQETMNSAKTFIDKEDSACISIDPFCRMIAASVMYATMFNEHLDWEDSQSKVQQEIKLVKDYFITVWKMVAINNIKLIGPIIGPIVRHVPFLPLKKRIDRITADIENLLDKKLIDHEETLIPDDPRDIVDSLLIEASDQQKEETKKLSMKTEQLEQFRSLLVIFYPDLLEQVPSTLKWLILYAAQFQNYQDKIFDEITQTTDGNQRPVNLDMRKDMPLTQAFILEVLRHRGIGGGTAEHSVTEHGVTLNGYNIPMKAKIYFNLYSVLHDEKSWENPSQFHPERFLAPDGLKVTVPDTFATFGYGHRACLGKHMTKMAVFIVLTSLIQMYKMENVGESPYPDKLKFQYGGTPLGDFNIRFIDRE